MSLHEKITQCIGLSATLNIIIINDQVTL